MAVAEVNGVSLSYAEQGAGDPPFVFIHGWTGSSRSWSFQVADLAANHRCVTLDLRGCGESPAAQPNDLYTAAEDVAVLIPALDLPPAILVGHSLGGLVALITNSRHGELVRGVVTVDSPLDVNAPLRWARSVDALRESGNMDPLADFVETLLVGLDEDVAVEIRATMLMTDAEVAAGMLERGDEISAEMKALVKAADQKPFMAIWAEQPFGDPNLLRDVTLFARQEPVVGSAHFVQMEKPAITNALLRAFVDDVRRDPRLT